MYILSVMGRQPPHRHRDRHPMPPCVTFHPSLVSLQALDSGQFFPLQSVLGHLPVRAASFVCAWGPVVGLLQLWCGAAGVNLHCFPSKALGIHPFFPLPRHHGLRGQGVGAFCLASGLPACLLSVLYRQPILSGTRLSICMRIITHV